MPNQTLATLAPAAGTGIGKLLADSLLVDPKKLAEEMRAVVERGFHAQKRVWDAGAKTWAYEEDCRTQIQTLALVLAHMEGEPIKRIVHQHLGEVMADAQVQLRESPALREALEHELEKAKFRTRKVKSAPPAADLVPVESVPD